MIIIPKRISIEITTSCNLLCRMCFLTGFRQRKFIEGNDYLNKFFDASLLKKLINELSESNLFNKKSLPFSLSFTGGEPFLHAEIFELLRYAREKNVGTTVYTNGTLIDSSFVWKICEAVPEALMFSIDGSEEVHDQVRGEGNFKKTCETIKLIQLQKRIFRAKRPRIYINTVINNLNIDCLSEIFSLAEFLNIDGISFSHIQWSDSRLSSLAEEEFKTRFHYNDGFQKFNNITIEALEHNLVVTDDKIDTLISQVNLIKERYKYNSFSQTASIYHLSPFRPDLSECEIKLWYSKNCGKINFCDWVYEWIRIGVDGDVQPICSVIPFSFGNITNQSLEEILSSEKTQNFFREIKSNGFFYVCQRCCRRPGESLSI